MFWFVVGGFCMCGERKQIKKDIIYIYYAWLNDLLRWRFFLVNI